VKNRKDIRPDLTAQTPEQMERVSFVDECFEQAGNETEKLTSYAQLAYYAGKQWIGLSRASKSLVPIPAEPGEVQYTANRIMPVVRTEQAKVLRNKLAQTVVPASSEDSDLRAARIGDKVAQWLEYELDLQDVDQEAVLWALITRIGFVVPTWDTQAGEVVGKDKKGDVHEGQPRVDVCSVFDVVWDMSTSKWSDVRWVGVERVRSVEYVKQVFDVDVSPEESLLVSNVFDGKLSMLTTDGLNVGTQEVKDCVRLRTLWQAPCPEFPKGRTLMTANGRELYQDEDIGFGEEDKTNREIPVFPLIHIRIPGRVIGTSVVEQLMPVQREYNTSRSQIIENKNLMSNPKWLVEANSIPGQEITREGGQVIHYTAGANPPVMTQPRGLGPEVNNNIERCLEEFQFISGQREVSHGSTPTGVTAGVAIQLLQEQDDTQLAPTIQQYARWKRRYMSYLLKMVRFKFSEERTIKLVGKNKKNDTITFRGSQLTSTDIRYEDISATSMTKAAKQSFVIELVNSGVLNAQEDKDLIIRMLEMGITDELYDGMEIDVNQAITENGFWARQDMNTPTRDFYNHEVHVAQHNKFRKGDEYESLPPEMQELVDLHVQEHMEYIMAEAMAQQAQQAAAAPGTGSAAGETGMDVDKVMAALSPEEQQYLQQNPQLLDSIAGGGPTPGV